MSNFDLSLINIHKLFSNDNVDAYTEALRDTVFVHTRGCYSCFDLVPEFVQKPSEDISLLVRTLLAGCFAKNTSVIPYMRYFESSITGLKVYWYWDGDGTLIFELPNGLILVNSDCKKEYDWSTDIKWAEECLGMEQYYSDGI